MLLPRDGHIIPEYISVGYDIIHVYVFNMVVPASTLTNSLEDYVGST